MRRNIREAIRFIGARALGRFYPVSVTFIVTYRCNLRCLYCNVPSKKIQELSSEEARAMIDEFRSMGTLRLSFNGGEPLLREDISQLVRYAKGRGFFITIFTNGWCLKEKIRTLEGVDVILVSIDGPSEVHDMQRGRGSFEAAIDGIKAARDLGFSVWINTVITKYNVDRLNFIINLCKDLGVRATYQPVFFYPHSSSEAEIASLSPSPREYAIAIDNLISAKSEGAPIVHSREYLMYIRTPVWQDNPRNCWAGKYYCAVTPDGRVAPCYPVFDASYWPSGRELGFRAAFEALPERIKCEGCYCILVENDFLYSLRPRAAFNMSKEISL